jgi:hypothetical protein
MADSAGDDSDDDFVVTRLAECDGFDLERLTGISHNRGLHLAGGSFRHILSLRASPTRSPLSFAGDAGPVWSLHIV